MSLINEESTLLYALVLLLQQRGRFVAEEAYGTDLN